MCRAVGKYVKETYFGLTGWEELRDQPYNVSFIHSESTQIPRVTVSGESAVMGMWPGSLPFVDFKQTDLDIEMSPWTSWPAWKIRNTYSTVGSNLSFSLLEDMVGKDLVDLISGMYPQLTCTKDSSKLMECLALVQDVLASNKSEGLDMVDPVLGKEENWDKLRSVVAMFTSLMLAYDPHSEYDRMTGSLGYPMAQHVLGQIKYQTPEKRVHHYACHDWTLLALYSAIGHWQPSDRTDPRFVPRYSETLILEEHRAITSKGADQPIIMAYWGYPNQSPPKAGASYELSNLQPAMLRCLGEGPNEVPYNATNCPLEDLERYVNTTAPKSPSGICYATEESLQMNDCAGVGAAEPGSRCYFYRERCPAEPCANIAGAIADVSSNFSCVVPPEAPHYMATTLVALICPTIVFGAVLGFFCLPKVFGIGQSGGGEEEPIAK